MEKVFQDAKDKYVAALVVYGKTADKKLYTNAAMTVQAVQAEVEEAFIKGVLVIKEGTTYLAPVKVDGTKVITVSVASSTVSGTEWTVAPNA